MFRIHKFLFPFLLTEFLIPALRGPIPNPGDHDPPGLHGIQGLPLPRFWIPVIPVPASGKQARS